MNKLEALKYFMQNYDGPDGGFAFATVREIIEEDNDLYTEEDLDLLIDECNEY